MLLINENIRMQAGGNDKIEMLKLMNIVIIFIWSFTVKEITINFVYHGHVSGYCLIVRKIYPSKLMRLD